MAETFLVEEVRPDDPAAVGGEALVGERNPDGRSGVFGVKVQAHRLVRLRLRLGRWMYLHKPKAAKRCSSFQAESFRLRRTRFAFGDISLEDLKRWRKENLAQLGRRGVFPI